MMDNKFFTFIAPFLSAIDDGRFFRKPVVSLYESIAVVNLIVPFYVLYRAIENGVFDAQAKYIFVFILVWITIAVVSWVGFQIWWNRKDKVNLSSASDDEFITIPVFSHFVQTLGEWLGIWVAVVGFVFSLLAAILLGRDGYYLGKEIGLGFFNFNVTSIILMPIYGFLIVIVTRFFAEASRALVAIANNTKKR
jgi:hypothetical protein